MTRFTAEEALDARHTPDAVMVDYRTVNRIIRTHSADFAEFLDDMTTRPAAPFEHMYDAGDVFAWLGY